MRRNLFINFLRASDSLVRLEVVYMIITLFYFTNYLEKVLEEFLPLHILRLYLLQLLFAQFLLDCYSFEIFQLCSLFQLSLSEPNRFFYFIKISVLPDASGRSFPSYLASPLSLFFNLWMFSLFNFILFLIMNVWLIGAYLIWKLVLRCFHFNYKVTNLTITQSLVEVLFLFDH